MYQKRKCVTILPLFRSVVCCPHHSYVAIEAELMAQPSESEPQEVPHDGMRQRKGGI